jgi:hypothetical protein
LFFFFFLPAGDYSTAAGGRALMNRHSASDILGPMLNGRDDAIGKNYGREDQT